MKHSTIKVGLLSAAVLLVAGCGGGKIEATIGGTVNGLAGNTTLTLLDNGTDTLAINNNGSFTFTTQVQAGQTYGVTIGAQPVITGTQQLAGEICTVANGYGIVEQSSGNVTSVTVNCVATISANNYVSGTVSGLAAGKAVNLTNNGTDTVAVSSNGSFAFPTALPVGTPYNVIVSAQPAGQSCVVAPSTASGTIPPANRTPVPVTVTCS